MSPVVIVLGRFKTGLVQFIDMLINWMPEDEELLVTRILIQDQIPIEEVMQKFIKFVKPHETAIKNRNEIFFMEDPKLFSSVKKQDKILSFKKLWLNQEFSKSDREKTWMWMDFFVKCINLYIEHSPQIQS